MDELLVLVLFKDTLLVTNEGWLVSRNLSVVEVIVTGVGVNREEVTITGVFEVIEADLSDSVKLLRCFVLDF